MNPGLAFLLSLPYVITLVPAVPLTTSSASKIRSGVSWRVEQLTRKINQNFKIPHLFTTVPPSGEQYGASSLVLILKGYNNLILDSFKGAENVKPDIESLYGFVDQWKQQNCADRPQPQAPRALVELRGRQKYDVGVSFRALYRVKEYLRNLQNNMSQLETCT